MKTKFTILMTLMIMLTGAVTIPALAFSPTGGTPPTFYVPDDKGTGTQATPNENFNNPTININQVRTEIAVRVIEILSNLFIGYSVIFIVIAGYQYAFSAGDDEKIKKAHMSLLWASVGVLLVMLAYTIIFIVTSLFG
jgi:hypothetical protein